MGLQDRSSFSYKDTRRSPKNPSLSSIDNLKSTPRDQRLHSFIKLLFSFSGSSEIRPAPLTPCKLLSSFFLWLEGLFSPSALRVSSIPPWIGDSPTCHIEIRHVSSPSVRRRQSGGEIRHVTFLFSAKQLRKSMIRDRWKLGDPYSAYFSVFALLLLLFFFYLEAETNSLRVMFGPLLPLNRSTWQEQVTVRKY